MIQTVLYRDFKTLRQAYNEVKVFVEIEVGEEISSLKTKIDYDLGCLGDDNYELLEKFVKKYKLDATGFDYSKHFLTEGELFGSGAALLTVLTLPLAIACLLIKVLTFGKVDINKLNLFPTWQRQTLDITFGDMLTWYLTGTYHIRSDVKFKLTNCV